MSHAAASDRPSWPVEPPLGSARRARSALRASAGRATEVTRKAAGTGAAQLRARGGKVGAAGREAGAQLLATAGPELRASLWRLGKVRTPQGAVRALEEEIEHLLLVVAPLLVEHPLPVRRAATARVVVGGTAAAVALGEELDEVATLFSAGTTVAPSVPVLATAAFLALASEVAVAASLRVHDLRAAGAPVLPEAVAEDVVRAMAGGHGNRNAFTKHMVKRTAARLLSRWGTGLVPVVGAAYSAWDAQRTIAAIRRLPIPVAAGRLALSPPTR